MDPRRQVTKGMTVYTHDGDKLGKVALADDIGLFVVKGLLFPKEYGFRYDDVEDVRDDGVHLRLDKAAIARRETGGDRGPVRNNPGPAISTADVTPGPRPDDASTLDRKDPRHD